MSTSSKVTPFLWFDNNAEEAINFYISIFKNSRLVSTNHYGEAGPGPAGQLMGATFELDGRQYHALNGGPHFKFTEAISLFVSCENQEEVDSYWDKLTADGGAPGRCGWLKDKFGLSWQIVPTAMTRMLQDKDPEKSKRVMQAIMQMDKLDLHILQIAYEG